MPDDWDQGTSVDSRIVAESLIVDVDGFEGPLDLLLTLAADAERSICGEISVLATGRAISRRYVNRGPGAASSRLAADYLVMAAWLAYLKSRLLLAPRPVGGREPSARKNWPCPSGDSGWSGCKAMREAARAADGAIRRGATFSGAVFRKTCGASAACAIRRPFWT
jgi:hypothetical protein